MRGIFLIIMSLLILPILGCEDSDILLPEDLIIQIDAEPRTVQPGTSELDPEWGKSTITARILDTSLLPIQGVGVIFAASPSGVFQSTWDSTGNPMRTDSSGRASDVLHTDGPTTVTALLGSFSEEVRIYFGQASALPVAILFAHPYPAKVGQQIVFDGSGSLDPDGSIAHYKWEIHPDLDPPELIEGPDVLTLIRKYDVQQNVEVILTVTDDSGGMDSDSTIEEVVNNLPPVADAGPNQSVPLQLGQAIVTVDHSQSYDPDGQLLRIQWDCDNGTILDIPPQQSFGQCVYTQPADYFPTVKVWDDGNGTPGYPDQKSDEDQTRVTVY